MHIYDLPDEEEVQVNINGTNYDLKLLKRDYDADEYNASCEEWCALRELCTEAKPNRGYCDPFKSMYLGYAENVNGMELTFQLSNNL